jgi:hypothetical protein
MFHPGVFTNQIEYKKFINWLHQSDIKNLFKEIELNDGRCILNYSNLDDFILCKRTSESKNSNIVICDFVEKIQTRLRNCSGQSSIGDKLRLNLGYHLWSTDEKLLKLRSLLEKNCEEIKKRFKCRIEIILQKNNCIEVIINVPLIWANLTNISMTHMLEQIM